MANTTIYPYGTNGQLPSSIGVIDDLTTGGADKALSAEMGKELNNKINELALAAYESNGKLYIYIQLPDLTVTPDTISLSNLNSDSDVMIAGNGLSSPIQFIIEGDFAITGTNVVNNEISAAHVNGNNVVNIAYIGSSMSASGTVTLICGSITKIVQLTYTLSLPAGYVVCDYVENTHTEPKSCYIDTGIPTTSELRIILKVQNSTTSDYKFLVRGGNANDSYIQVMSCTGYVQGVNLSGSHYEASAYRVTDNSVHEIDFDKNRLIYDNGTPVVTDSGPTTWSTSVNLFLGGYNDGAPVAVGDSPTPAKFYKFKVYNGTTLVAHYIPAYETASQKYGFYDLVSGTFKTSQGTYDFTGLQTI